MDDARAVVTGESKPNFVGVGFDDRLFDLLSGDVQALLAQDQQVGEQFIDSVVADLHHHHTSERSGDLGQLAALPVALVEANDVGQ